MSDLGDVRQWYPDSVSAKLWSEVQASDAYRSQRACRKGSLDLFVKRVGTEAGISCQVNWSVVARFHSPTRLVWDSSVSLIFGDGDAEVSSALCKSGPDEALRDTLRALDGHHVAARLS